MSQTLFAVTRKRGPAWKPGGMREQVLWDEHAAFLDDLAARGVIVLGGPLDEGETVLLIVAAPDATAVEAALAPDPWHSAGLIETVCVQRWTILLEGARSSRKLCC